MADAHDTSPLLPARPVTGMQVQYEDAPAATGSTGYGRHTYAGTGPSPSRGAASAPLPPVTVPVSSGPYKRKVVSEPLPDPRRHGRMDSIQEAFLQGYAEWCCS